MKEGYHPKNPKIKISNKSPKSQCICQAQPTSLNSHHKIISAIIKHPQPHPVSAQPLLFELFEESSAIFIILIHQNFVFLTLNPKEKSSILGG